MVYTYAQGYNNRRIETDAHVIVLPLLLQYVVVPIFGCVALDDQAQDHSAVGCVRFPYTRSTEVRKWISAVRLAKAAALCKPLKCTQKRVFDDVWDRDESAVCVKYEV